MNWKEDLSPKALEVMKELGSFGPTVHIDEKMLKGWMYDEDCMCKTYWSNDDLRGIAAACIEVAEWLEKRAFYMKEADIQGKKA